MNGTPSASAASCTGMMCGWSTFAASRASAMNRSRKRRVLRQRRRRDFQRHRPAQALIAGLNVARAANPTAEETLLVLMITACLAGVFNSIREVVKERGIYDRERAAGLSAGAYLTSKVLVLGVIAVYQAVVITAVGVLKYPLPANGSLLTHEPFLELCAATAFLELASTFLGLLVSALVSSSDLAMQVLIIPVMIQIVFSGGFFTLTGVFAQVSALIPGRWGFAALASTARLNEPNKLMGVQTDPRWDHTACAWLTAMGAMLAWSAVYLLLAWWLLNRRSPGRRKRARSHRS